MGAGGLEPQAERSSALHGCEPQFAFSTVSRMVGKRRPTLLQVLVKRLIVNQLGEIVGYELNKPFAYLHRITRENTLGEIVSGGSDQVRLGGYRARRGP